MLIKSINIRTNENENVYGIGSIDIQRFALHLKRSWDSNVSHKNHETNEWEKPKERGKKHYEKFKHRWKTEKKTLNTKNMYGTHTHTRGTGLRRYPRNCYYSSWLRCYEYECVYISIRWRTMTSIYFLFFDTCCFHSIFFTRRICLFFFRFASLENRNKIIWTGKKEKKEWIMSNRTAKNRNKLLCFV